jgi:hypothetical protein
MKTVEKCYKCGKKAGEARLQACVVCHRLFCRACAERRSGKALCSPKCVDEFFFAEEDDVDRD